MTILWAALFGSAIGSFTNAAIERLPRGESLHGRSRCEGCSRPLQAWELVPVVSYVALLGRCGTCDAGIGIRTPLIEGATALLWAACFLAWPPLTATPAALLFTSVAATTTMLTRQRLPR